MVELQVLPNLISIKESIHMELVKGLLEKYPSTHEEVQEALESLKSGSDDALGHWHSFMKKGTSHDSEIRKMMKQNEANARPV